MAIEFVQQAVGNVDPGTSLAATFSSTPTSSNLLVACVISRATTLTNPDGWTTAVEVFNATENDWVRIAYKIAGASESTTVTFVQSSDTAILSVTEWSGLNTSTHDQTASTGRTLTVTSLSTGTTGTTTESAELAIAAVGVRAAIAASSFTNSFALREEEVVNTIAPTSIIVGSKVLSSVGTQETTASWITAGTAMAAIATFKSTTVDPRADGKLVFRQA